MASTTPTTADTLVTLKINIEGTNRRFKLPLRDLIPSTLPDKVCHGSTSIPAWPDDSQLFLTMLLDCTW